MKGINILQLQDYSDQSGSLVVAEFEKNFNFPVKRIFYITSNSGKIRGKHAHKEHAQFFICINGACSLEFDNGSEKKTILLDSNDKGVEVRPGVWGQQNYMEDNTILLVLSDHIYDENDYLRSYDEFIEFLSNIKK